VLDSRLSKGVRFKAALKAFWFYCKWYPKQWLPSVGGLPPNLHPSFKPKLKYIKRTSKVLARELFHAMIRYGPKLDKQQLLLGALAEIGTELFVITASVSHAQCLLDGDNEQEIVELIDCIFNNAKLRVQNKLNSLKCNNNKQNYSLAKKILAGDYKFLENIV